MRIAPADRLYTVSERALHAMETKQRVRINETGVEGVITEMYVSVVPGKLRVAVLSDMGRMHHVTLEFGTLQFQ